MLLCSVRLSRTINGVLQKLRHASGPTYQAITPRIVRKQETMRTSAATSHNSFRCM